MSDAESCSCTMLLTEKNTEEEKLPSDGDSFLYESVCVWSCLMLVFASFRAV